MKQVLRWIARIASLVSAGLIVAMAFDGGNPPTSQEWIALALFPVTVLIGFGVSWRKETIGALISLAGLAAFYAWMGSIGRLPSSPYFLVFASPAVLFLLAGLAPRDQASSFR